jgi:putative transposase
MARLPRLYLPGVPSHAILRGNNRQAIFCSEGDRIFFHRCLAEMARQDGLRIHAYVMMTNHVHLLASSDQPQTLSRVMQRLGRRYVSYFNFIHKRTGTLWEGRFRSTLVGEERYLLTCHRYIEQNPVRAGMVEHPGEYPWSSHRCHSSGVADDLVTPHPLIAGLADAAEARRLAYRELFAELLSAQDLQQIRDSLNKGWAYGSPEFVKGLDDQGARRPAPLPMGRPRKKVPELA